MRGTALYKKDDDRHAPKGWTRFFDARAVSWSIVIPLTIVVVLLVRSRTGGWGLHTSSARAMRFEKAENLTKRAPPGAEEPDTDPTFDPEGDAQRIKQETAARAAASLEKAAKAGVRKKPKTEIADDGTEEPPARETKGAGAPGRPKGSGGGKPKAGSDQSKADAGKSEAAGDSSSNSNDGSSESSSSSDGGDKSNSSTGNRIEGEPEAQPEKSAPAAKRPPSQKGGVSQQKKRSGNSTSEGSKSGKQGSKSGSGDSSGSGKSASGGAEDIQDQPSEVKLNSAKSGGGGGKSSGGRSRGGKASGKGSGTSKSKVDEEWEADGGDAEPADPDTAKGYKPKTDDGSREGNGDKQSDSGSSEASSDGSSGQIGEDNSSGGGSGGSSLADLPDEEKSKVGMMSVKVEAKKRPHRRRKTDFKVVVVPAHKCQLLDDPLANACMYGGLEEAHRPECKDATKGQMSNAYLPAFTRIQPYISQYGLRRYSVADVWDGSTEEAKAEWQAKIDDADILVLDELAITYLGDKIKGKRLIALQRDAAASMRTCDAGEACAEQYLKKKEVWGYLQHTSLKPLTLNNAARVSDVVHLDVMDKVHQQGKAVDESLPVVPASGHRFTEKMLAKVYTIVPMIWRWRFPITCRGRPEFTEWMMKALQGGVGDFPPFLRPMHERPVDVAFYGTLDTKQKNFKKETDTTEDDLFKLHRKQMTERLEKLKLDAPEITSVISGPVDYETFAQGLRNTKLFISPLGKSEQSGKDYEAVISRAVLLKPLAHMLVSYPNIYEPEVSCVEIKADYSDLEEVVKGLLGDPARMQRIADEAYQRLLSHSLERPVAQDVAETVMDIIEANEPEHIVDLDSQ